MRSYSLFIIGVATTLFCASSVIVAAVAAMPPPKSGHHQKQQQHQHHHRPLSAVRPPISGCYGCGVVPDAACCSEGQLCPGQVPCCGKGTGPWSCNTTCVPQCGDSACGDGGCTGAPLDTCGTCAPGTGCVEDSWCAACCRSSQKCGPSDICPGFSCGSCPTNMGCESGDCHECCPAYQKCGSSVACPGVSCGSCPAGQGCDGVYCHPCCGFNHSHVCGESPYCAGASCGPPCKPGTICEDGTCEACCPKENGCGTSACGYSCGQCNPSAATCPLDTNTCRCRSHCVCGDGSCAGCPAESAGCDRNACACLGPLKPSTPPIHASALAYFFYTGWNGVCDGATECGSVTPINQTSSPSAELQLSYVGESGYYAEQTVVAIYSTGGQPLPGDQLYFYFKKNNSVVNCCNGQGGNGQQGGPLTIQVTINNCSSLTQFSYCRDMTSQSCFTEQSCGGTSWSIEYNSVADGSGIWIPNPKTSVFQIQLSVTDVYYQCNSCGNNNAATLHVGGFYIQAGEKP